MHIKSQHHKLGQDGPERPQAFAFFFFTHILMIEMMRVARIIKIKR